MAGELQSRVGLNLKAHREALGLSQEAFADVLGVHRTYMGSVERGERNLTLRSLERLAARIEVDPLELLRAGKARRRRSAPLAGAKSKASDG